MTPLTLHAPEIPGVLSGRVTRIFRVLKLMSVDDYWQAYPLGDDYEMLFQNMDAGEFQVTASLPLSPGEYWVRETWARDLVDPKIVRYEADHHGANGFVQLSHEGMVAGVDRWHSPAKMPRRASRASIRVTDVRVHRVQDIAEQEVWAAGLEPVLECCGNPYIHSHGEEDGWQECCGNPELAEDPRIAFAALFNAINGPGSWEKNPWVVGAEIRRIEE